MDINNNSAASEGDGNDTETMKWIHTFFEKLPTPIKPIVETLSPNAPFTLCECPVELFIDGGYCSSGIGNISLNWLPVPALWYTVRPDSDKHDKFRSFASNHFELGVKFNDFQDTIERTKISGLDLLFLTGDGLSRPFKEGFTSGGDNPLTKVVFHVANCILYMGAVVGQITPSEQGFSATSVNGRCHFTIGAWNIVLDRTPQADELKDAMNDEPGYGLTHVGEITRNDGASFCGRDAKDLLEDLAYLLSFCTGRWCGPLLAYGFNESGTSVWVDWHVGKIDPWRKQQNWFPRVDESALPSLAVGFLGRLADPLLKKPLRVAISWYLDTLNPSTVDTGIVLGQVGLELIAWTHLVHAKNLYSKTEFKGKEASAKIALLLNEAGVSPAIPTFYAGLAQYAASVSKNTGPEVFVKLRNALVHGSDVQRFINAGGDARTEAWILGVSYLELAVLRMAGYMGQYHNRASTVREATVYEDVPWAVRPITQ